MTLTRIIPSLRRTLPDPLAVDSWPEGTVATTVDVVISGISLLHLVEVCGTPSVHGGASVIPRSGGRPSSELRTTVLVARVVGVRLDASGHPVIETDARLDDARLVWSQARLLGRVSTAHSGIVLVDVYAADLPLDVRVGDLIAIPSRPERMAEAPTWLSVLE